MREYPKTLEAIVGAFWGALIMGGLGEIVAQTNGLIVGFAVGAAVGAMVGMADFARFGEAAREGPVAVRSPAGLLVSTRRPRRRSLGELIGNNVGAALGAPHRSSRELRLPTPGSAVAFEPSGRKLTSGMGYGPSRRDRCSAR